MSQSFPQPGLAVGQWHPVLRRIGEFFPLARDLSASTLARLNSEQESTATDMISILAASLIAPAEIELVLSKQVQIGGQKCSIYFYQSLFPSILGRALICAHNMLEVSLQNTTIGQLKASKKQPFVNSKFDRLLSEVRSCCHHRLTKSILMVAKDRGIPYTQIQGEQRLFMLGTGSRGHLLTSSCTDRDSHIGATVCQDKRLTNRVLRELGIPTTRQINIMNKDDIIRIFPQVAGKAWVLKPPNRDRGEGVTTDILSTDEALKSYDRIASMCGGHAILEQQVSGSDHRLTVVNGRLAKCIRRDPPSVTGDGVQTVAGLIDQVNSEKRRQKWRSGVFGEIEIDEEVIDRVKQAGLAIDDILTKGVTLRLRGKANLSTGGMRTDVTEHVHPSIADMSVRIAAFLSMNILGIDYFTSDICEDPSTTKGVVIELNGMPQLLEERASLVVDALSFESKPCCTLDLMIVSSESLSSAQSETGRRLSRLLRALLNRHHYRVLAVSRNLQPIISDFLQPTRENPPRIRVYDDLNQILIDKTIDEGLLILPMETVSATGLPNTIPRNVYSGFDAETLKNLGLAEFMERINAREP